MISVIIGNSLCKIDGLNGKQFCALQKLLSAPPKRGQTFPRRLIGRRGDFPTGLLYLVRCWVKENCLSVTFQDRRRRPERGQGSIQANAWSNTPYPEQKAAVEAAVRFGRGIISMPTGTGKSQVAAMICAELRVATLIVVPSLELKKQTIHGLREVFGEERVGELGKDGLPERLITVENVDALDPKTPMQVDCIIIDEFHHSGAKTYRLLNQKSWTGVYYKFGLTATPFRTQDEERLLLESVLSQVIYRLDYATAAEKGYVVPVEAYYVDLPNRPLAVLPAAKGFIEIGADLSWDYVYGTLVVNCQERNKIIAQMLENLAASGAAALCLVKELEHGDNILTEMAKPCAFMRGENRNNRMLLLEFNLRERLSLLGTEGILGEGLDTKPAEYIIIAGGGKSKSRFMQQVGRGVRRYPGKTSCKVIIFRDPSHKWTLKHFRAECKILREEYGVRPIKLKLEDL